MKYLTLFLLICFCVCSAYAQWQIEGKLLKNPGNKPIAFANIGIINSPVGTISNEDGSFSLRIPEKYSKDSILFSALGFQRKSFSVDYFTTNQTPVIYLSEEATLLNSVMVLGKPTIKSKATLGNRKFDSGSIYTDSVAAGAAMALLIENKYPAYNPELVPPYYIKRARLRIAKNTMDDFKIRVRILEHDTVSGLPGNDLFHENKIIISSINKGWIEFDLERYNIRIERKSFFIAFEWLVDKEDRVIMVDQFNEFKRLYPKNFSVDSVLVDGQKIVFNSWKGFMSGTSFGSSSSRASIDHFKSYYRKNSYGVWRRSSYVLAAQVSVSTQPYR